MDSPRRVRLPLWLLLPVVAALFHLSAPETTPADSALLLERAAALQHARAPGSGEVIWPSSTVWAAYPLAAVQAVAGRIAGAEVRSVFLERTEAIWRHLLRAIWALLAAAIVLRLLFAWLPEAPLGARIAIGLLLLIAPILAIGTARLLPAVPAALVLGELLSRRLRSAEPRPRDELAAGIGTGLLLAWFPFAWVVLPIVLLTTWRRGGRAGSLGRIVGPALLLALVLEPTRLMQPGSALLRAVTEWQRGGGWSGPGGGGAPVFLALGAMLGGSAWLLWPAAAWGGRGASRREDALVGIGLWLLAVLVPLLTGVRRPGALQWSVAPWLLAWGTAGARSLPPFRSRSSVGWAVVVGVLLVGVVPARWSLEHQAERTERVAFRLRAELPALLGSTDLCVSEFAWNAAEGDTLARRLLVLPKDSRAPARYDFAYWSRWYAGFRWVLLSGARVGENLGRQDADAARRFYAAVTRDGVLEREWGERDEGYRLYRIRDGSEWRRPFREAELGAFRGRKEMSWYLTQLGDRYLAVGDARAVEALSRVGLVWDPDSPALYSNLGVACLRLEDPAEAAKAFDAGLRLSPRSFELLWNLALACVQADLYPRAEMVLRRAVELRPEFAPAHYELGRVFLAQNKPGLARLAFERFLELDPSSAERGTVEEVLRHLAKDASP